MFGNRIFMLKVPHLCRMFLANYICNLPEILGFTREISFVLTRNACRCQLVF